MFRELLQYIYTSVKIYAYINQCILNKLYIYTRTRNVKRTLSTGTLSLLSAPILTGGGGGGGP